QHEPREIGVSSKCGGLKISRFPVDHSVYGACAWTIETSGGPVVYTGDLRCHGGHGDLTWKFAAEAAKLKPRALIIEGTRIKDDTTSTEAGVRDRALDEVRKAKGLVVADFGARNIERLASFLAIARATGRRLLLLDKDVYLLECMASAAEAGDVPSLDDDSTGLYAEYAASSAAWKKGIRERYGGKLVSPREVAASQRDYICCFSFFDVNELAYIRPAPGSIWIYSSCEAFNEEMRIDMKRLRAWLDLYHMVFMGGDEKDRNNPFHVSGHACKSDLLKLIETIQPQTVIPVHTEHPEIYAEELKGKCEVILPERGGPIEL
ncbi:MAG: exonuclease, partial [Armatimonadetes bacterium]|nr:exonuclease [Armatimonadota bacterium]